MNDIEKLRFLEEQARKIKADKEAGKDAPFQCANCGSAIKKDNTYFRCKQRYVFCERCARNDERKEVDQRDFTPTRCRLCNNQRECIKERLTWS